MNKLYARLFRLSFFCAILSFLGFLSCSSIGDELAGESGSERSGDTIYLLQQIQKRGKLLAITDYNTTNYFIYRGDPMGYHYEILEALAKELKVKLEIVIENEMESGRVLLDSSQCDIMAMGLTVTTERKKKFNFLESHIQSRQVLVQAYPQNWQKIKTLDGREKSLVRNLIELGGKEIYVQSASIFRSRLVHIANEIGDTIFIIDDPRRVEDLIVAVANYEIPFTIADEYVGRVSQKYYPNLDVKTPISFLQNISWAISPYADTVSQNYLNKWMRDFSKSRAARILFHKYFGSKRSARTFRRRLTHISRGEISQYDSIVQVIGKESRFDWRLISSLIYQESEFNAHSKSWVGAYGLMQLMPRVMNSYQVDTNSSAEAHIRAGVSYLKSIYNNLPETIADTNQRLQFALASYNAGIAHVADARRLAIRYKRDPNIWKGEVDFFMQQKSNPKYYRDSVVKYGRCRGQETYQFVEEILERYQHYCNHFPENLAN